MCFQKLCLSCIEESRQKRQEYGTKRGRLAQRAWTVNDILLNHIEA